MTARGEPADPRARLARWWPVLLIAATGVALCASGVGHALSLETLGRQQATLQRLIAARPVEASALYVAATAAFLMLSLPGEGLLTAAGGLLFGTAAGTLMSLAGTIGAALVLYLSMRHALGRQLARRRGAFVERLQQRMNADGFNYLLTLRLLPVLPFSLVSLLAVLVRMRLGPYALATTAGVIPTTVIFAAGGNGLRDLLSRGAPVELSSILSAGLLLPLLGLALLALAPVAWRHARRRRD